jgi:hypothetical protein
MRMSEINVKKSSFFKTNDLEELTGQPWAVAQLIGTITSAEIGEYPGEDGKPPEPSFLLTFAGIAKPLGCNLTNREVLQAMCGDVEWNTQALAGVRVGIFATSTSMGPGIRLRAVPDTIQEASATAREVIDRAIANQAQPPRSDHPPAPTGDPARDEEPPPPSDDGNYGPF